MSFGPRLKELRKARKWSQSDLCDRINVAQSMIAQYENDHKLPSSETLINIARTFDVSIDYLLGLNENKMNFNEKEIKEDPDLLRIVNLMRPKIKGVAVSDEQWDMITIFLESVVKQLEAEGKLPKS